MTPIEAVTSVFRNYANFNGRAQRSEFWWFVLFSFISQAIWNFVPILGPIYALVLLLPSLAVTARRLHDTNRTAWWMLLYLIPILGFIVLTIAFIAVLGISTLDPWATNDVEWGILGILFLIWLLVSIAAWIVLLVFQIMPGTAGPNRYGPDPLRQGGAAPGFEPGFSTAGHPYEPSPPTAGFGGFDPGAEPAPHPDLPPPGATRQSDFRHGSQSQPASERQRRYCTQCGTPLQPEARFCTYCGTGVS